MKMLYPTIESLVFVGKNLSDEDKEDTWYFQFASSYGRVGSFLKTKKGDRRAVLATKRDLGEIFDLDELTAKLKAAAKRRRSSRK